MSFTLRNAVATLVLAISALIVAMAISWLVLAAVNFSYGFWHDHGGIETAIEKYGNANEFKTGFADTTRAQRLELFRAINKSIHNHGEGLAEISFQVPSEPEQTLLREPEVVHLQDVANLIDAGLKLAVFAWLIWMACWSYFALSRYSPPKLRMQLLSIAAFFVFASFIVVLIGPVKVFYWLHTVLFPDEHQWFFYYQESLMSTMMHAPYLFGWIAIEWVLLTFAAFVLIQAAMEKLLALFTMGK